MLDLSDIDSSCLFPQVPQLCRVCRETAAGFHFGAFTCEGCKSFFGRAIDSQAKQTGHLFECKGDNSCVIDGKNRTSCKSCRFQKCVQVGMSKSASRYGRRSNFAKVTDLAEHLQQIQSKKQNEREEEATNSKPIDVVVRNESHHLNGIPAALSPDSTTSMASPSAVPQAHACELVPREVIKRKAEPADLPFQKIPQQMDSMGPLGAVIPRPLNFGNNFGLHMALSSASLVMPSLSQLCGHFPYLFHHGPIFPHMPIPMLTSLQANVNDHQIGSTSVFTGEPEVPLDLSTNKRRKM